ncbi:transcription elongation factor GreA [Candidatus Margulisiibacteriota bacterium]
MSEKMTKASYGKLKKKVEELKGRRAKISKTIGEARDHGDLKENSAYHSAKDEQGLNEMRIRDLEGRMENAVIVKISEMAKKNKVTLGSTVKIKDLDSEDELEYTVVDEIEADVLEGKLSIDSPIGEALIGAKKGEVLKVDVPAGKKKYKVLEIK